MPTVLILIHVERRVGNGEKLWELKVAWPIVLGNTGNETEKTYYFKVLVKKTAPAWVTDRYEKSLLSI